MMQIFNITGCNRLHHYIEYLQDQQRVWKWKKDWESDGEIEYDEHEGFESSEGKGSEAFDDAGNTIDDYDDFEGGGNTEVVAFGSRGAPWNIWITYDNGQIIYFEDDEDSWTVKIVGEKPENIADYQAVLEVIRILLNCQ